MKKYENKKCFSTKIIGGTLKGKNICIPAVSSTRSSKAVIRESLFNSLQFEIVNKLFVEVFAGSGSVALEAVSRGASHAWCMEYNPEVYALLRKNIEKIAPDKVSGILGDSFKTFPDIYEEVKERGVKTFFYFDPPFSIRKGMESVYRHTFELIETIETEYCQACIVEHMTRQKMPDRIGSFYLEKSKRFGKSSLSYYFPTEELM